MNLPAYNKSDSKLPRMFPFSRNRRKVKPKPVIIVPGFKDGRPARGLLDHPVAR